MDGIFRADKGELKDLYDYDSDSDLEDEQPGTVNNTEGNGKEGFSLSSIDPSPLLISYSQRDTNSRLKSEDEEEADASDKALGVKGDKSATQLSSIM